ncbi:MULTISPECIES: nitric oxide reductase D protein [unclassified Ruegeria]|uniref:nitric oxide reductase activation protein NorD n=1 Tax=unclassified Ruegeria TaxID=2625375 RepID=UPI001ADC8067|nr:MULTISPECIES: nitric oxide reductase D protein [unclassified Ruegeria]MBO9411682.1 nitric oxide reductase D protein [Ruegeria sp. R8_1]MBO9415756.1 nitric oxide reductase D protein [Ruegeria sp. R8_2]
MVRIDFEPWEPEETIGKLWHTLASRLDAPLVHDGAAVDLSEVAGRLAVLFRGLGGSPGVELRPVSPEISRHRLSWRRKLATEAELMPRASFDGEVLRLPDRLAVYPLREANGALYVWLAAAAAHAGTRTDETDPLRADLRALAAARQMVRDTLEDAPGLRPLYAELCKGLLHQRNVPDLPPAEAAVESIIRNMLGDPHPLSDRARAYLVLQAEAPRGYQPFRPVPLWPDLRAVGFSEHNEVENPDTEGEPEESGEKTHRARRRKSDQAERSDSFILHKFEAILSWAEFLNINRRIDDDDPDNAKKAADDQEEIGLGQISKAPPTKLKLHLDLAPEDVNRERLSGRILYPEWDVRTGQYLPDHVNVLLSDAEIREDAAEFGKDPATARRIRAVKRQFEALRPGRVMTRGHLDGDQLDIEAAVRAEVDRLASGEGNERIWMQSRPEARDLAVSILLDVSRSTESAVTGRAVIDIEREALTALAWGLNACGDDFAIHAFSSLKRQRVYVQRCKRFDEPMGTLVEQRIASLRPGHYTRLGAAVRHCSADLAAQLRKRRLLLVITDGKPNDLDHYEGRHGIEDTRQAVHEARRAGQSVFGVTIDKTGKSWFPRMFGQGGFAVIPDPHRLTMALPQIYRQLVGA